MNNITLAEGLERTTCLGIGAHPDDLETIALPGILDCYQSQDQFFSGVIITDGAGAPRGKEHRGLTSQDYVQLRAEEQIQAAEIGRYSTAILLGLSSAEVRSNMSDSLIADLQEIIKTSSPEIIFTHNPFDNHPTHLAVCVQVLEAVRGIPINYRPELLAGMELWGTLEWLPEEYRLEFNTSNNLELQQRLLSAFPSQNTVKAYPEALLGRRKANAVLDQPHNKDLLEGKAFGMDLTLLVKDSQLSLTDHLTEILETFQLQKFSRL